MVFEVPLHLRMPTMCGIACRGIVWSQFESMVLRVSIVLQVFVHIYSYLKSTTTLCHGSVMSQNGEASSSNATRPTVESDELQSLSKEQHHTVKKCTSIVH